MKQPTTAGQKNFALTPTVSGLIQRSVFKRDHGHKSTFNVDDLIPFYVDEILPGDDQKVSAQIFARIPSPLTNPIMDNMYIDTFYFFVPNRIIWTNWEKLQGAQDDPADSIDFTTPSFDISGYSGTDSDLKDYLGIPPRSSIPTGTHITSLYARAYNLIYKEWFRDENLQDSPVIDTGDGPDDEDDYSILKRNKSHDYFTSCLPWTQKGTAPTVSLGTSSPVIGDGTTIGIWDGTTEFGLGTNNASPIVHQSNTNSVGDPVGTAPGGGGTIVPSEISVGLSLVAANSGLIADLANATGFTINSLRETVTIQQLLEIDARSGSRYTEILKAQWGVSVPDFRLQRPEYLGGGSQPLSVNPMAQTSASPSTPLVDDAQGNQAAYVTGSSKSGYSKSFVEHGVIIGLVNIRSDLTYSQGLPKMFQRETRYDYFMPVFNNIGEQAVRNSEIWWQSATLILDEGTFGYQEAWADYRYAPSRLSGLMRVDATGSLSAWNLSEDFGTLPTLNTTFIQPNTPIDRVKAVTAGPDIIFDSWIKVRHAREMSVHSIPGLRRF